MPAVPRYQGILRELGKRGVGVSGGGLLEHLEAALEALRDRQTSQDRQRKLPNHDDTPTPSCCSVGFGHPESRISSSKLCGGCDLGTPRSRSGEVLLRQAQTHSSRPQSEEEAQLDPVPGGSSLCKPQVSRSCPRTLGAREHPFRLQASSACL